jgi:putative heme iron utilization protein
MDTQGFERGNLTYRHMLGGQPALLDTRVVKYDELLSNLPSGTAMVSPAERAAAMWERFRGIRRRYVL